MQYDRPSPQDEARNAGGLYAEMVLSGEFSSKEEAWDSLEERFSTSDELTQIAAEAFERTLAKSDK